MGSEPMGPSRVTTAGPRHEVEPFDTNGSFAWKVRDADPVTKVPNYSVGQIMMELGRVPSMFDQKMAAGGHPELVGGPIRLRLHPRQLSVLLDYLGSMALIRDRGNNDDPYRAHLFDPRISFVEAPPAWLSGHIWMGVLVVDQPGVVTVWDELEMERPRAAWLDDTEIPALA